MDSDKVDTTKKTHSTRKTQQMRSLGVVETMLKLQSIWSIKSQIRKEIGAAKKDDLRLYPPRSGAGVSL